LLEFASFGHGDARRRGHAANVPKRPKLPETRLIKCRDINPADLSQATGEDSTALAILRKKASPNKLLVDDATNDDNSVITMHTNTMDKLGLFRGDTVLVRGKKRKDTVLIVLADDEVDESKVRLNKGMYQLISG